MAKTTPISAAQYKADLEAQWTSDLANGTISWFKDIMRNGSIGWLREAWTLMPQTGSSDKIFAVERFRLKALKGQTTQQQASGIGNVVTHRVGYYTVFRNGNRTNEWGWAQFSPIFPDGDLMLLINQAQADGTI
jgi:hypothetical protein